MLLKKMDDKQSDIDELRKLSKLDGLSSYQKSSIEKEILITTSGIRGENQAAYELDFQFKDDDRYILIHDLRIEIRGKVAQIDHLLITQNLVFFVFETKNFSSGLKITELGEFLRWDDYSKKFFGMPSPLAQNTRHIDVLKILLRDSDILPKRLGLKIKTHLVSFVLVPNGSRVDRPKNFDTSTVIKCEVIAETISDYISSRMPVASYFSQLGSRVSMDRLKDIGNRLTSHHRPIKVNYRSKFRIFSTPSTEPITPSRFAPPSRLTPPSGQLDSSNEQQQLASISKSEISPPSLTPCMVCNSKNTVLVFRMGYYIKCKDCNHPEWLVLEKDTCHGLSD